MPSLDKKLISKLTKKLLETEKRCQKQKEEITNLQNFFLEKKITKKSQIILNCSEIENLKNLLKMTKKENLSPILQKSKISKYKKKDIKKINLGEIAQKISKMNSKLEKEGRKIKKSKNIAYFQKMQKLPLFFYKNGIKIGKYPFCDYRKKEAEEIILDLLEGFYPKILEKNFPDGVFFEIEDLMEICYDNKKKISKDDFLKKIPKQFISKNGDIVNIRNNLNGFFRKKNISIEKKKKKF